MGRTLWLVILAAGFGNGQPAVTLSSVARDMIAAHNAVRARVRLAPLVWSNRLAASSQAWADALLKHKQFVHSPHATYGENLYEIRGAMASSAQVVHAWAEEARDYDYSSNRCHGVCGHYTQIVWRDTQEVGCAVARGGGREVWVCQYDPPGNWAGKRPY